MASYWGLQAIAARMEVNVSTVWRWHRAHGFLMWRRRKHRRTTWYTNDALIYAWERERCKVDSHAPHARPRRQQ